MIILEISILQRKSIRVDNPLYYFPHVPLSHALSSISLSMHCQRRTTLTYEYSLMHRALDRCFLVFPAMPRDATHTRASSERERAFVRLTSRTIVRKLLSNLCMCAHEVARLARPRHVTRARLIRRPALHIAELEIIKETRAYDQRTR